MSKERSGKQVVTKKVTANKKKTKKQVMPQTAEFEQSLTPLMPELDELVKKNPNRLIGCGG